MIISIHPSNAEHPITLRFLRAIPGVTWVKWGMPCDYMLTHSRAEHASLKGRPESKIVLEHELPGAQFKRSPYIDDPTVKRIVLYTEEQVWSWGLHNCLDRVFIIPSGHDFSGFPIWRGGTASVLNATNSFAPRDYPCGFTLWDTVTRDLPRTLAGFGNEGVRGAIGFKTPQETHDLMSTCNVFFNTTRYSTAPNALIEAMAIGMPIVSTSTWFSEFLLGGLAPISDDPVKLHSALSHLLAHPDNPHAERNRRFVRDIFDMDQCIARWVRMLSDL